MLLEIISWLVFGIVLIVILIDLFKDILPNKKDKEVIIYEKDFHDFIN